MGADIATTYISAPSDPKQTLGVKLPYLVMIIKNMKKPFAFEVQVLDDRNIRRRFRASNYQSQAVYHNDAHENGRGMESNPVQPRQLHEPSIPDCLHRDSASADPRELPHPSRIFLQQTVL